MTSALERPTDSMGRPTDIGWVSGSALASAMKCAASAVIWRVLGAGGSASRIGSALHDHIRQRNLYGIASALVMMPELAERHELTEDEAELFYARARAFEWMPPEGAIAELALCLFEDGRVEAVEGGKGRYDGLPADALIPAQIDLFWAEPKPLYRNAEGRIVCPPESVLWVIDWKSGKEEYVEDAERNAQAIASAVLAAKFTGAKKVLPGIVFLRRGEGVWDIPENYLDEAGIERAIEILTAGVMEVRLARAHHRRGLPLVYRQGSHCNMCGARHACPAHLATLKSWLGDPNPIEPGALNDAQLAELATLAPSFRAFAASVDAALRAEVEARGAPLKLPDGRVYGPHTTPRDRVDSDKALAALGSEIGAERAAAVGKRPVTLALVKRAIAAAHEADGKVKMAGMAFRRVYGRLAGARGIEKTFQTRWGSHKPPREIPSEARQAVIAEMHGIPMDSDDDYEDE